MKNKQNLNIEIGKRLRRCRKRSNMTQEKLAEIVDCSVQTLSITENGKKGLSVKLARKLAHHLNVREEYLLCEDDFETEKDKLISLYSNDNSSCLVQLEYLKTLGININIPIQVIKDSTEDDYNENPEQYFKTIIWRGDPFETYDDSNEIDNFQLIRLKKNKYQYSNGWITKHDEQMYAPQVYVVVINNNEHVLNYDELSNFLQEIDRFSYFIAENFFISHITKLNTVNIE